MSAVQQSDPVIRIHTSTLSDSLPIQMIPEYKVEFLGCSSRSPPATHSIGLRVHVPVSSPQTILLIPHRSSLVTLSFSNSESVPVLH